MDYSLEQSRLLQCRDFYTQNYAKQIDFAGSFAICVLTGVRNKFQGYEPAKIGVGPPRDAKSRDTLGRILVIFAAVCHRVYYRFTDSGRMFEITFGDTARHSSVLVPNTVHRKIH